jgi:transaldolase
VASLLDDLTVKIFADGADLGAITALAADPLIKGFTTNPTLMRKAGVADYERFARAALEIVTDRPVSFEVFSDDFDEMEKQALCIAEWGPNVFVKVPVTNTARQPSDALVRRLSEAGVQLNVTALLSLAQVERVVASLGDGPAAFVSVFAGRVADTGVDPVPLMARALELLAPHPQLELIWASPRELLNLVQASSIGCHVITMTHDLLAKVHLLGMDLDDLSLETVRMFHNDATHAGYTL